MFVCFLTLVAALYVIYFIVDIKLLFPPEVDVNAIRKKRVTDD